MSENPNVKNEVPGGESTSSVDASWQDVGKQFEALGQSLAEAVRTAWEKDSTQAQVREIRTGLEAMVRDIDDAIQDSMKTPEGQKIRQEAERAAESLKTATNQTVQEARPHIVEALEKLNTEIQKLIQRMQGE